MSSRTIRLIAAPPAMQPGGYVAKAYADHDQPRTGKAEVTTNADNGFVITLRWACAQSVIDVSDNPRQFTDACALLVPEVANASWITMGGPGGAVQGVLWRADQPALHAIRAEGLGSVQRSAPPADWKADAAWRNGQWEVTFTLPVWAPLAEHRQFAVAIWQGAQSERAGLKSVSEGWMPL